MKNHLLLLALVGLAIAGCGGDRSADARPRIHYGEEECSTCRMIVSEERHASVLSTALGEVERFDDLRCLFDYLGDRPAADPERVWVHAEDLGWIGAPDAWFASSGSTITPMGSGLAAFSSRETAERLGPALSWSELSAGGFLATAAQSRNQEDEESL